MAYHPEKPQREAYRLSGFKSASPEGADSNSSRLARTDKVKARVKELRDAIWQKDRMSLSEAMNFAERSLRTPIDEIDETSDLAQEKTTRSVNSGDGPEIMDTTIKMFPKQAALAFLSKVNGWEKPKTLTHEIGSSLDSIISFIRKPQAS